MQSNAQQVLIIFVFGVVGWALCGAIMFIGRAATRMQITLIVNTLVVPVIFAIAPWL